LEHVIGGPARVIGCSAGAVIALLIMLQRPDLVRQLVCVAGVFHRDGWVPEAIDPTNEPPQFLADSYGEVSPDGVEHFPVVIEKLAGMNTEGPTLTAAGLRSVACRTLVMVGDDDEVTLEHATEFYRGLPNGELVVIPGTSHGLLVEKPDLCNTIMIDFLTTDAVPTLAPIRRRSA
jgi:pimeloyl-ACP methyl ester carboxylesterase